MIVALSILMWQSSAGKFAGAITAQVAARRPAVADPVLFEGPRTMESGFPWMRGTEKSKVLFMGSYRGPNRFMGCGVRELVLLKQMVDVGRDVTIIHNNAVTCEVPDHTLSTTMGWTSSEAKRVLSSVTCMHRVVFMEALKWHSVPLVQDIVMFGWVWNENFDMHLSKWPAWMRERTSLMIDDLPFIRCKKEHRCEDKQSEAATYTAMHYWLNASARAYALSLGDKLVMDAALKVNDEWPRVPVGVWPLDLTTFSKVLEAEGAVRPRRSTNIHRGAVVMIAAHHAVNVEMALAMLSRDFTSALCSGVHSAQLIIVGGVQENEAVSNLYEKASEEVRTCIKLTGKLPSQELAKIMNEASALLNPYMRHIDSGIAVKVYEALAQGMPLITTDYGINGLHDCIPKDLLVSDPGNLTAYAEFIHKNVRDPHAYEVFQTRWRTTRQNCFDMQKIMPATF